MSHLLKKHALVAALIASSMALGAHASTLRVVPSGPLQILDPSITTAYITRDHGFLVFDTLFGTDINGKVQPEMVDKFTVDANKTTWSFTLRDGLKFSDGSPVTSADVIASLERWEAHDTLGGALKKRTVSMTAVDAKTFQIKLSAPFGPLLEALGKPSAIVPFIMPKAVIDAAGAGAIKTIVGSGPFEFVPGEFKPGEKAVYIKNPYYKPRGEPASGTAGGKLAKVDKVEFIFIRDAQTAVNALKNKEVDYLDAPSFQQVNDLAKDPGLELMKHGLSVSYVMRFNNLTPPFDNVKVRQAAMLAVNQKAILNVQVGVPGASQVCASVYPCGTKFSTSPGAIYTGTPNFAEARKLLKEANYDDTPIVILDSPEIVTDNKIAPLMSALLQQAGFKTKILPLDWASWLQKRTDMSPANAGGWNVFFAAWSPYDLTVPTSSAPLTANGKGGWPGWFEDKQVQGYMNDFLDATTEDAQKAAATQIQNRELALGAIVPLGQTDDFGATRKGALSGLLPRLAATVYWDVAVTGK